jgi:hypothetical protein
VIQKIPNLKQLNALRYGIRYLEFGVFDLEVETQNVDNFVEKLWENNRV